MNDPQDPVTSDATPTDDADPGSDPGSGPSAPDEQSAGPTRSRARSRSRQQPSDAASTAALDAESSSAPDAEPSSAPDADVPDATDEPDVDTATGASVASKPAARTPAAKTTRAKKTTAKRSAAKKTGAKKTSAKKATAKTSAAKKSTARKTSAKKTTATKRTGADTTPERRSSDDPSDEPPASLGDDDRAPDASAVATTVGSNRAPAPDAADASEPSVRSDSDEDAPRRRAGRKRATTRGSRRPTSEESVAEQVRDAEPAPAVPGVTARVDAAAEEDRGSPGEDVETPGAADEVADGPSPQDASEAGRKRRRRGRRGRGRGRSGRGTGTDRADQSGDQQAAPQGAPQAARGKAAPDVTDTTETSDAEQEVEQAIAKGGTRVAAKRGRRGAGGSGERSPRSGNGRGRVSSRPGGVPEEVRRAILEGPPRTMLVTAFEDRTQIAVLEDRTVVEHYVTRMDDVTYVGNIYMARVQNVLPGMEAAFLDIGKGRNGVLYAGEVLYDELDLEEGADERIENVLKPGQKVLVQVTKDPMGSKGPRLTMHLSLAGRYMVLAPGADLFGISRKLTDQERDRLRRVVKQVKPPEHGVIVRTAAEGATDEQLRADLERLLVRWERVVAAADGAKALTAVYEEPPLVVKVIRDNFGPEFERCVVDDDELYHQVRGYLGEVAPELMGKVELYGSPTADARARAVGAPPLEADAQRSAAVTVDDLDLDAVRARRAELPPLFDAYDVTEQLRKAMGKKVWLPSGGYLIVESTEAMKVIDVNTGRFTGGAETNLEEIVLKTNLEAADEIVRQLRLRDMGGIIIIDFIDMLLKSNQDQVVRRLKRELLRDRTKTRVSEVSRLGLVQMTRKNVSQGLIESFSHACDQCEGRGIVTELH